MRSNVLLPILLLLIAIVSSAPRKREPPKTLLKEEEIRELLNELPSLPEGYERRATRASRARSVKTYRDDVMGLDFEERCYRFIAERESDLYSGKAFMGNAAGGIDDTTQLKQLVVRFIHTVFHDWQNQPSVSKESFCTSLEADLHQDFSYTYTSEDEEGEVRKCNGRKTACKCFASRHGFGNNNDASTAPAYRHKIEVLAEGPKVMVKVVEEENQEHDPSVKQVDFYTFAFEKNGVLKQTEDEYLLKSIDHSRIKMIRADRRGDRYY